MLNTSFYHSQQSSRPLRRPNEPCPMMPRSSWYPPKAPHKAANNRHFDDETPGSAIQKIQSERNIFGAPSNHTVVHMPRHKPKRTNAARNSCPRRATIHGTLETTSKEPWDPVRSQDPSASSSSSNPEHTMAVNNMLIIRGHAKSDPLKWVENWDHSNAMQQNAPDHRTSRSQKVEHGPIHPHHVVIVANNPCNYAASSHSQLPIYHPPYYNSTSTCSPSTSSSSSISFHTHHQRRISTDSFEYGRTDVVVDDLHRRASTISDTNVTASTADTYRRFSDGSSLVSSQSTAASSVIIEEEEEEEQKEEHIELQNDDKQHDSNIPTEEIVETNKMEEENEGHEKDQDQEEKKLSNYGDAEEEHDAKPSKDSYSCVKFPSWLSSSCTLLQILQHPAHRPPPWMRRRRRRSSSSSQSERRFLYGQTLYAFGRTPLDTNTYATTWSVKDYRPNRHCHFPANMYFTLAKHSLPSIRK